MIRELSGTIDLLVDKQTSIFSSNKKLDQLMWWIHETGISIETNFESMLDYDYYLTKIFWIFSVVGTLAYINFWHILLA